MDLLSGRLIHCLPNIASIITAHNKSILQKNEPTIIQTCNCRVKESCPLIGKCLLKIPHNFPKI